MAALTLDEKASLTAGIDFWHTAAIPRLGIPSVKFTDGPNGARGETDGFLSVTPSICIPSATALGATWDPTLVAEASAAVARQARDKGARVLLARTDTPSGGATSRPSPRIRCSPPSWPSPTSGASRARA